MMEIQDLPLYTYAPLLDEPNSIRLVRLLPSSLTAPFRCEVFNYSLSTPHRSSHLYECLSYVWGSPDNKRSIVIEDARGMQGARLDVTENLYAALLRLRDPDLDRVVWIDAICINQEDLKERAEQVKFMAMIYACASRVVVWLGEEEGGSSEAMDAIRARANQGVRRNTNISIKNEEKMTGGRLDAGSLFRHTNANFRDSRTGKSKRSNLENAGVVSRKDSPDLNENEVLTLLQRSWFRRVWVLQEVAAARTTTFICGTKELSGSCFYQGLLRILSLQKENSASHASLSSVAYLLSHTNFPKLDAQQPNETFNLDIRPLSQLIDMFRTRDATDRRDKIYALLGMARHDPELDILKPDYGKDWLALFKDLVRNILGDKAEASLVVFRGKECELITSIGDVLGWVSKIHGFSGGTGTVVVSSQNLIIKESNQEQTSEQRRWRGISTRPLFSKPDRKPERPYILREPEFNETTWVLHDCANPVRVGDKLCLIEGARKPIIIRGTMFTYFAIIAIAVSVPSNIRIRKPLVSAETASAIYLSETMDGQEESERKLQLLWPWDVESPIMDSEKDRIPALLDDIRVFEDTAQGEELCLSSICRRTKGIYEELDGR